MSTDTSFRQNNRSTPSCRANTYSGWPPEAIDLVEKVIGFTGGWELWNRMQVIRMRPTSFGSPLPVFRGMRKLPMPSSVEVDPHADLAVMYDYPTPGTITTYKRGELLTGVGDQIRNVTQVANRIARHRLLSEKLGLRAWSALEIAFFFGQAITNYFAFPFLLPSTQHLATIWRNGIPVGVRVRIPPERSWVTHSAVQGFWFRDGLLHRHDYLAAAIGPFATASQFYFDYVSFGGLKLAQSRRVYQRVLGLVTPIPILTAAITDFTVKGMAESLNRDSDDAPPIG